MVCSPAAAASLVIGFGFDWNARCDAGGALL